MERNTSRRRLLNSLSCSEIYQRNDKFHRTASSYKLSTRSLGTLSSDENDDAEDMNVDHSDHIDDKLSFVADDEDPDGMEDSDDTSNDAGVDPFFNQEIPPISALHNYYSDQLGVNTALSKRMVAESKSFDGKVWWTVDFQCPLSPEETYPSGVHRGTISLGHCIDPDTGRVYYARKQAACHAAAARAMDVIQFQKLGVTEPRLCEEDPSAWKKSTDVQIAYTSASEVRPMEELRDLGESLSESHYEDPIRGTTSLARSGDEETNHIPNYSADATWVDSEEIEDKHELVIRHLPRSGGSPPIALNDATLDSITRKASGCPRPTSFEEDVSLAVRAAEHWIASNRALQGGWAKKDLHRVFMPRRDSSSLLHAGKSVLSSLAKANQSKPFSDSTFGVKRVAYRVMDILQNTKYAHPDVGAFNSLLLCLEGPTPKAVALKAESLVNRMSGLKQRKLAVVPKPDINTINILIQLWAQVGGVSGRYANTDDSFQPNRWSFLAILSSSAYRPTIQGEQDVFDVEFARLCIERMKELYVEHPDDPTLKPDTQVYNTPLRWSGGSRPYVRRIEWDAYEEMFSNGFQLLDEESPLLSNARAMASWIEGMKMEADTKPNIESYEALIQGWVRTGTRAGLLRAEAIAEELLNDFEDVQNQPRLQTFHPIIAAWLYSKDSESLCKVQGWVDRLFDFGKKNPAVRPDGRMIDALIASRIARQEELLSLRDNGEVSGILAEEIEDLARRCLASLKQYCGQFEQAQRKREVTVFLPPAVFVNTLKAWRNVAFLSHKDDRVASFAAVEKMLHVIELLEFSCQTAMRSEHNRGTGISTTRGLSDQIRLLVANSHHLYFIFASTLREIDSTSRESDVKESYSFNGALIPLESMLRRSVELFEIERHHMMLIEQQKNISEKSTRITQKPDALTYEDCFDYGSLCRLETAPSREAFIWQLVQFLGNYQISETNAANLIRLSHTLKEVSLAINVSQKLHASVEAQALVATSIAKLPKDSERSGLTLAKQVDAGRPSKDTSPLQKIRRLIPTYDTEDKSRRGRLRSRKHRATTMARNRLADA